MDTQTTVIDIPKTLLSWSAPSHVMHVRSKRWYMAAAGVAALCILYGVFFGAWSFALVIVLTIGAYIWLRDTSPASKQMAITPDGWQLGDRFTHFSDTVDFWILSFTTHNELHIQRKGGWNHHVMMLTGNVNPEDIRAVLKRFIPENTQKKERFLDAFIRLCKL